ncbi:MAG: non-homologous end-joining DNA ligase [Sphingomonadales bacterium]
MSTDWQDGLAKSERALLRQRSQPRHVAPMLATLTENYFSDAHWIYERKLDGERIVAMRERGRVRLLTRNKKNVSHTYPELSGALAKQPHDSFIVDGEVVAFAGGATSFARLQQRMQIQSAEDARESGIKVYYYLFDLLYLDGWTTEAIGLRQRKAILKNAFAFSDPLRFTPHRNRQGERYFKTACAKGWEGIIAKKADSRYRHKRSHDWLKFKCSKGQELVIAGYTPPQGTRLGFGALLLGYYDGDRLQYAGKVGTGFDDAQLKSLHEKLRKLRRETCPFDETVADKDATWVTPKLVAEIGFTEWTRAGKLRHPRFLGLRRDKPAGDVTRESI